MGANRNIRTKNATAHGARGGVASFKNWCRSNRDAIAVTVIGGVIVAVITAVLLPPPKPAATAALVAGSLARSDIEGNKVEGMPLAQLGSASDVTIKNNTVRQGNSK